MYRPVDLARAHGLSAQAVRNYEDAGVIPPARRTASGYRVYTDDHVGALGAYVALLPGYGYRAAAEIMRAVLRSDVAAALAVIDAAHVRLHRDRETVTRVASAVSALADAPAADAPAADAPADAPADAAPDRPVPVGVLAHRLDVTPATLRKWERAGILSPTRVRNARMYSPDDVRDAELAHLLRRGGYPLGHIATVLEQVRAAGGAGPLAASIDQWRDRLTARGRAMLTGAARLDDYLSC
ncbi:MerR family transcriptional regulator [Actinoplanes utahensis]|uniref:MerR family transcriptional regulator n=1 Tax=Actinoplanes utahensis TaxID=1869 RepID=A0A0A6UTM5_ACTUT|nr:MerR family transcriptional regulator [Actinoplanes utahensis]KHD78313.1 MerR family transcriptional regulator [Actinoplanes utahensis]GIF28918.1 MerR family transcriptional regulator [Actinoplanes utahensis]